MLAGMALYFLMDGCACNCHFTLMTLSLSLLLTDCRSFRSREWEVFSTTSWPSPSILMMVGHTHQSQLDHTHSCYISLSLQSCSWRPLKSSLQRMPGRRNDFRNWGERVSNPASSGFWISEGVWRIYGGFSVHIIFRSLMTQLQWYPCYKGSLETL